jgi:hypothetical protein
MMSNIKEWQDGYFTTVKRVEEPVLKFAGERAETIAKFVPERPSFMAEMPTMQEFVETQLKFRKKFVDEQVAFTRKMIKAMHPVFVKLDSAPKHVEPKPAAARMAAKRPVKKVA